MTIFTTSPQNVLALLNAASKPKTILTGSGAKNVQLEIGKVYRFQAQGAPSYLGFGATAAEADANSAAAAGEFTDSGEIKVFCVTSPAVQWVSRTDSANTDVRIWEMAGI